MYHYSWKKTRSLPPKRSRHAADLMQRRSQRIYGSPFRERKDRGSTASLSMSTHSGPQASASEVLSADANSLPLVSISLLGTISLTLHASLDISRTVPLRHNIKYLQLLAYLAWMRGKAVQR